MLQLIHVSAPYAVNENCQDRVICVKGTKMESYAHPRHELLNF